MIRVPLWFGFLAGAATIGLAIGAASSRPRRRRGLAGWREGYDKDFAASEEHVDELEKRIRGAGARGALTYVGAGAEGVTVCDEHGQAFKVGRTRSGAADGKHRLRDEAEWLMTASKIASIKQHVPRGVRYDATNDVIARECLVARSGSRANSKRLWDLHQRMAAAIKPYGHGQPEYKNDAYVYTRRGPVLVDAGFAVKRGNKLVKEALDVANGRKKMNAFQIKELAWELRMERGETIPEAVANKVLRRLQAIEPGVEL